MGFEILVRGLVRLQLEGQEIVDRHFNLLKSEVKERKGKERKGNERKGIKKENLLMR